MIRKKNLQSLTSAICAGTLLLINASCDNDNKIIEEEYEFISPADPTETPITEEVTQPTAILGNFGAEEDNLHSCFTNIVEPSAAKIIIVAGSSIKEYEDVLSDAYGKGTLIAVFNPNGALVADWSERNDIFYAGPEGEEKCAIYGFNNAGTYYSLHDVDGIDDDEVPLFHFCSWINSVTGSRLKGVDLRSKDIRRRFAPQSITHTFKLSLDESQLVDEHWANIGQLSLSTTANVTYNIYPIHAFDGNATGDYYAVEAEMVLRNAPMDNGKWARRRGDEITQICGFYLSHCDLSASLLRKSNGKFVESVSHTFAEGAIPHPTSLPDAADYNPGFEWGIDATVCGGVPDSKDNHKLTSFNNWTWNNSSDATLPGIEIKSEDTSGNVGYSLLVNGLPDASDDITVTAIPDLATGDLTFKYSWIWRVSDIDQNSNECIYMQVGVNPFYRAYQWLNAGQGMTIGEFGNNDAENKSVFRFPVTPPNRIPTCSAVIRNSSDASYYVSDIKFWRDEITDAEPDYIVPQTICTATATGGSGINATMLLIPAGNYMVQAVRYSIEDDQRVNEEVIVTKEPLTLNMADNVTIDFGSDIFVVK
ncbi:MAG: hypothetical protein HDR88_07030 [Bacteroides sp.]|nr:hypothetical protein [Bacteroides sp.]